MEGLYDDIALDCFDTAVDSMEGFLEVENMGMPEFWWSASRSSGNHSERSSNPDVELRETEPLDDDSAELLKEMLEAESHAMSKEIREKGTSEVEELPEFSQEMNVDDTATNSESLLKLLDAEVLPEFPDLPDSPGEEKANEGEDEANEGEAYKLPSQGSAKIVKKKKRKHKPATCPVCARLFLRKYEMVRHVKATHLQMKPFNCRICHGPFSRKTHLRTHMWNIHNTEASELDFEQAAETNVVQSPASKVHDSVQQRITMLMNLIEPGLSTPANRQETSS